MHCNKCGNEVPDRSIYCNYCGHHIGQPVTPQGEDFIETCQIVYDQGRRNPFLYSYKGVYIWASAIEKNGPFNAGASPKYDIHPFETTDHLGPPFGWTKGSIRRATEAHRKLVTLLVKMGGYLCLIRVNIIGGGKILSVA